MPEQSLDKGAPMSSAPMKYRPDGAPDWGAMWDSYCALPRDGGPPHRATMLCAQEKADPASPGYGAACAEIAGGIQAVSGLSASPSDPGWLAVHCPSAGMARWLAEAIVEERVGARADGKLLLLPVGDYYTVEGEIKNVITVVAKTTHYWNAHVPLETKRSLATMERIAGLKARITGRLRRTQNGRRDRT